VRTPIGVLAAVVALNARGCWLRGRSHALERMLRRLRGRIRRPHTVLPARSGAASRPVILNREFADLRSWQRVRGHCDYEVRRRQLPLRARGRPRRRAFRHVGTCRGVHDR
jgi:hypothetical protein